MKITLDTKIKLVGLGLVPWTRLGLQKWLPDYAIASLYGWDMPSSDELPTVYALSDKCQPVPVVKPLNTQSLIRTSEFQELLDKELPGYDILTYKPVSIPAHLQKRKFLMVDPRFTRQYENKVWFRRTFQDRCRFPSFAILQRQELQPTEACFEQLQAGRAGFVLQDEQLSGGKGTFIIRTFQDYVAALENLKLVSQHQQVVVSELVRGKRERSIQACVTADGVITGPLQRQIIAHPDLTNTAMPHGDKFSGAQILIEDQETALHQQARQTAQIIGQELRKDGYRGIFGVDFLLSEDDELYVIEVNPRITGVTPLLTAMFGVNEGVPFYLLHVLELGGYDYEVTDKTATFDKEGSLLVLHSLSNDPVHIKKTLSSGTYRLAGQEIVLKDRSLDMSKLGADEFIVQEYMPPSMIVKPGGRLLTLQFATKVLDENSNKWYNNTDLMLRRVREAIKTEAI